LFEPRTWLCGTKTLVLIPTSLLLTPPFDFTFFYVGKLWTRGWRAADSVSHGNSFPFALLKVMGGCFRFFFLECYVVMVLSGLLNCGEYVDVRGCACAEKGFPFVFPVSNERRNEMIGHTLGVGEI